MSPQPLLLLSAALALLAPAAAAASSPSPRAICDAVHIFLARGGNEPFPGRQGVLVTDICAGVTSTCGYTDIQFDATIGTPYATQVAEGATSGVALMTAYASACPKAKLVLSGYSLGAGVVGDLLAGADAGDVVFGTVEQNIAGIESATTSPGNQIAAVLLFGDVRHVAGQTYNVLSGADSTSSAPRPAANLAILNRFAGVMRSYCDVADPVCASGDDVAVHLNYFDLYSDDAAAWVRAKVGIGATASASATASETTAAAAAAATSTGVGGGTGKSLTKTAATTATTAARLTSTGLATGTTASSTGEAISTGTGAVASASASSASAAASAPPSGSGSGSTVRNGSSLAGLVGLFVACLVL